MFFGPPWETRHWSKTVRGRPANLPWDEATLAAFREALRLWLLERGLTPQALETELGYRSKGYLVRTYLGEVQRPLPPSPPFLERLKRIGFSFSPDRRGRPPRAVHHLPTGVAAVAELPPGTLIVGEPRQCPECAAEAGEGKRHPSRTWYVFAHPRQRYCSLQHRRAWHRRQRKADAPAVPEKQDTHST
jgi:hypothetical protein